ncbi:hypothetical protein BH23BAC3_BH23BAC3_23260 [soil metagenome]
MSSNIELPCSDDAVKEKTGRDWTEWCKNLDDRGADDLPHNEIAKMVNTMHEGGGWWSQTVTVGYERMRGKRVTGQKSDGTFSANAGKTLPVNASVAHSYFVEPEKRRQWLNEPIEIRKTTVPKSVRITWPDDTSVEVWISKKGNSKCSVNVEHKKLADEESVQDLKTYWKAALKRLEKAVS